MQAWRGVAPGGGGLCDWPSAVATATIGPCVRREVRRVAAVGIQKWRVWHRGGSHRSPERACFVSRAGERTRVPGAPARCPLPLCSPGACGTELDMEPQVSRSRVGSPVPDADEPPAGLGPACLEGENPCVLTEWTGGRERAGSSPRKSECMSARPSPISGVPIHPSSLSCLQDFPFRILRLV